MIAPFRQQGLPWGVGVLLPAAAAFLAGALVATSGAGLGLDHRLRSLRDGVRERPASGQVAIVEIDARSLQALDRWPLPRRRYAELVDRLGEGGVRSLAFDVDFSAVSNPADDDAFAKALARFGGGVILPTFRQKAGSEAAGLVENLPIPSLRQHAFLGSVNVHPDPDGQMRTYSYGVVTAGVPRPSIGALLAEARGRTGDSFALDAAIDPDTIPRFSFIDVLDGATPASSLRGKRVIVGATAIELGDRYVVPRLGMIPGVVVQALGAETLLQGSADPDIGPWPGALLALTFAIAALRSRSKLGRGSIIAVGVTLILGFPLALEFLHIATASVAPGLAMLALTAAIMVIDSVLKAFRRIRMVDEETALPNETSLIQAYAKRTGLTLAATHIARFDELVSMLQVSERAALLQAIIDRLRLGAAGAQIYRIGKDSFMWAVEGAPDDDVVAARLDGLAALFRSPIELNQHRLPVKPSFGLASGAIGAELRTRAVLAASHAAQANRPWAIYDEALAAEATQAMSLLADLSRGLAERQLWVAYQPKLDLTSNRIVGAEALVRWDHPDRGAISPAVFVPLLEAEGRAAELTLFVLDRALEDMRAWAVRGMAPSIALNISAPLLGDQALVGAMLERIAASRIAPAQIILEVTESAALACADTAIATLEHLRAEGFRISIDDYGTGQSTLSYLRNFPAHEIKIDQSFVRNVTTDEHDRILVRSTIELAHELGLKVVAEGLEDEASLELLRRFGCDTGQGWVIGRPVKAETFITQFLAGLDQAA